MEFQIECRCVICKELFFGDASHFADNRKTYNIECPECDTTIIEANWIKP